MIVHEAPQNTDEWLRAKLGVPSASRMPVPDLMSKRSTLKGWNTLLCACLAECMDGEPSDGASSQFMQRGNALEAEARRWYEMEHDIDVVQVGFCTLDDGSVGCSPDGLVGEHGGIQIKIPAAKTHVKFMLDRKLFREEYRVQVQTELYVTGRDWWDLFSYSPNKERVLVHCERDSDMIDAIAGECIELHRKKVATLVKWGYMTEAGERNEDQEIATARAELESIGILRD